MDNGQCVHWMNSKVLRRIISPTAVRLSMVLIHALSADIPTTDTLTTINLIIQIMPRKNTRQIPGTG